MAEKSQSQTDDGRRGLARHAQRVLFCLICALIFGIVVWGTEPCWSPSCSPNSKDAYYNLLVQGFQAGQLNVKRDPPAVLGRLADPYDPAYYGPEVQAVRGMSYYHGKLYLYFGIVPVLLLYWPYAELTGNYLTDAAAAFIFCLTGFLAGAGLLLSIWRRCFPTAGAWAVMTGILIFGLTIDAQEIEWAGYSISEVSSSSGFAFMMIAIAAVWRALQEPKDRALSLLLASLAYGLAIGSRPSLLPGSVILLLPVAQAWRGSTETGFRARVGWLFASAVVPITLIGLGLMFYNFLRFGSPLEFGYRYQLSYVNQTALPGFSPRYFWFNLRYYVSEPAQWTAHLPFLQTVPEWASSTSHFDGKPYYGGVPLVGFPLAWIALGAAWTFKTNLSDRYFALRWFVAVLFLAFATGALTISFYLYGSIRFEMDFLPPLMLLAVIGFLTVDRALSASHQWRYVFRFCSAAAFGYSILTNICASCDAYAKANYFAGNVLYNRGLMDEARERFQKALMFAPEDANAHGGLANVFFRKGDIDGAIAQYQIAAEQRPDFPEVYNNLGYCYLQAGRVDDAIIQYQTAIRLNPKSALYHQGLGTAFSRKGLLDNAIIEFKRVLELQPGSAEDSERLADAYFEKGMLSDAIVQYENVVAIKPDFAEAHNNLGYSLFMTGNVDGAVAQYRKAIKLLPDFVQAYNNLGNAYRSKGMAAEAIAGYQKAISLQPQFIPAQRSLAWMLATWPDGAIRNGSEALTVAGQANRLSGGRDPEILRALAAAYAETGRFPEAIVTAQQASSSAAARSKTNLLSEIQGDSKLYQNHSPCRSTMPF